LPGGNTSADFDGYTLDKADGASQRKIGFPPGFRHAILKIMVDTDQASQTGLISRIHANDGDVQITRPHSSEHFDLEIHVRGSEVPIRCQTVFSANIIEFLVGRLGCAQLPEFIRRYDEQGVLAVLKKQVLSYFKPDEFEGKRLLDFGCGFGASTLGLARVLPETELVGVDLQSERTEIAEQISVLQELRNVRFLTSPAGDQLPADIGKFDFVMLSAVYEHLLPQERRTVMPMLWSVMKPGAAIFINQTPYRYFPYEHHSTGLWFINYMPDKLSHFTARKFSKRDASKYDRVIQTSPNWETHLRGGLRGGTEWEIVRNLTRGTPFRARILQPRPDCARDRADYWLAATSGRYRHLKKIFATFFRVTDRLFGTVPSLNVDVVIRKETQ
jgi:2-polyprenyl-3-methyl-5-hydroxy-6-metoxy-1,4-benzoquinol methylase